MKKGKACVTMVLHVNFATYCAFVMKHKKCFHEVSMKYQFPVCRIWSVKYAWFIKYSKTKKMKWSIFIYESF